MKRIRDDIFINPLKGRVFIYFKSELMNFPVDYEDGSTHEDVGKTTGVSKTDTYV